MTKMSVDLAKMTDAANKMRASVSSITATKDKTKNVRLMLSRGTQANALSNCSRNLIRIESSILDAAVQMESLSDALETVIEHYRSIEANAASSGLNLHTGKSSCIIKKSQFVSFWERFRELLISWGIIKKQPSTNEPVEAPPANIPTDKPNGEAVTRAQEAAQDALMQEQIDKLLKRDRFSEKTWKAANTEERKAILNEYIQEVAGVMGLSMGSIKFFYAESQNGYYTLGQYSHSKRTVSINEWVIETRRDSYSLMKTVVHEMRHAYQHSACDNPDQFIVSEETIQKWQNSFDNYKSQSGFMSTGMNESEAFRAYRNQAVEADARNFAKQS